MIKKNILLIEDNYHQGLSIQEILEDICRKKGIDVTIAWHRSEAEALPIIRKISPHDVFDVYVMDLMLPWSREVDYEEPSDPRVVTDGALKAGFRLLEAIRSAEGDDQSKWRPAILYTISTIVDDGNGFEEKLKYVRLAKKDDLDQELAERVLSLLST